MHVHKAASSFGKVWLGLQVDLWGQQEVEEIAIEAVALLTKDQHAMLLEEALRITNTHHGCQIGICSALICQRCPALACHIGIS